jgi:maltooligosyltrehalose trehalohydrolase
VLYELHVGTFTPEGTFDAVRARLDALRALGVTAIELLPVAQFPGARNWGYDGVFPFAVQNTYGGLAGLRRLVRACHARNLGLVLDVVYNHVGPEGSPLRAFGPYFTDRYRTPWGDAMNFDGPESDHVRRFFLESARHLATAADVDGFRVDAVHAIADATARPFVVDLTETARELGRRRGRPLLSMAESSDNDPRIVRPVSEGGLGFDAVWSDDLHHAVHAYLTGERDRYYADYGSVEDIRRAWVRGFAIAGAFSRFRGRRHGAPARGIPADRFVVALQNHDQVGNRAWGDRLGTVLPWEALKLAAGAVLLSPFTPLLFMGEEYGETAPFLYFTDHRSPELAEAVRRGRRAEFGIPPDREFPDPQAEETFRRSALRFARRRTGRHRTWLAFYRALLALRAKWLPRRRWTEREVTAEPGDPNALRVLLARASDPGALLLFAFGPGAATLEGPNLPFSARLRLASSDRRWRGPGTAAPRALPRGRAWRVALAPRSFAVYAAGR